MPKIWKGSRKRRKQKTASVSSATNVQSSVNPLQNAQDHLFNSDNVQQVASNGDDDIFKLLDDAFLPSTCNKELDKENEMANSNSERLELNKKSVSFEKQEIATGEKELEFIPDDEVCGLS